MAGFFYCEIFLLRRMFGELMLRVLAILYFAIYQPVVYGSGDINNSWERLLHYDGAQSQITSHEFFVSPVGNISPAEEQNEMIRLLNSAGGIEVACNFPARYQWLYERGVAPKIDLGGCIELQKFLRDFKKDKLSLVYVSEYVDSPASAFGHLFLLFRNKEESIALADVVHFSAVTNHENFLSYAYKGLSGEFDAYFIREPYFLKQAEYGVSEQRALHIYDLDYSSDQINRIVLHLYELRKARFQYFFVTQNCAFQMAELLRVGQADSGHSLQAGSITLPIDVLTRYQNHFTKLTTVEPTLTQAEQIISLLTPSERDQVVKIVRQSEQSLLELSDKSKEVVSLYYEYAFRRHGVVFENYSEIRSLNFKKTPVLQTTNDPLHDIFTNRLEFGVFTHRSTTGVLFGYSPARKDRYDFQNHALQETEMTLFNIQALLEKQTQLVHKADFLKIQSLPYKTVLRNAPSWSFYAGFNRDNAHETLRPELAMGIGQNFGSRTTGVVFLPSLGMQADVIFVKPTISIFSYAAQSMKIGLEISSKFSKREIYRLQEIFVSSDVGKGVLSVKFAHSESSGVLFLGSISYPL